MTEQSRKPFNFAAKDAPLRDKDNAHPRLEPKLAKKTPAPNLAPGGAMGIRQGLSGSKPSSPAKRFLLGKTGDAKKEFKSAARNAADKDRSRGR